MPEERAIYTPTAPVFTTIVQVAVARMSDSEIRRLRPRISLTLHAGYGLLP